MVAAISRSPAIYFSWAALPVPVSDRDCGSGSALSIIFRVPFCGPNPVGVNVTSIVHSPPGSNGESQPLVAPYGLTVPLIPSINTVMPCFFLPLLGLVTVTLLGPLELPTVTLPNFSDAGLIVSLTGTDVGVAVGVGVAVAVAVEVVVAVAVTVAVGVTVAVAVCVAVAVGVDDSVAVPVAVAVGVAV